MGLSADTQMDVITPLHRQVDVTAAGRLRLPGDIVYTVAFGRSHHGTPFCLTNVSLPEPGLALASAAELTAEGATSEVTIIGLLDARLDAPIAEAGQSITVTLADGAAAEVLGCPVGHPCCASTACTSIPTAPGRALGQPLPARAVRLPH